MNRTLVILNDGPYGAERSYNGLRLAAALAKREAQQVRVFLVGDAAACAKSGQTVPNGYYNIERFLSLGLGRGAEVGVCGTCMDARGLTDSELVEGALRGTLEQMADWVQWADQVLVF